MGKDESTLLKLNRKLIKTRTDYGIIIYSSAKPIHLKIIESKLNTSLGLALGAF